MLASIIMVSDLGAEPWRQDSEHLGERQVVRSGEAAEVGDEDFSADQGHPDRQLRCAPQFVSWSAGYPGWALRLGALLAPERQQPVAAQPTVEGRPTALVAGRADQCDEMRCVDHAPVVLRGFDELHGHSQPGAAEADLDPLAGDLDWKYGGGMVGQPGSLLAPTLAPWRVSTPRQIIRQTVVSMTH